MATVDEDISLSQSELQRVVKLVYGVTGITLHEGKRPLILARLQKRLRQRGDASFTSYLNHLESGDGREELVEFINAIATNHTYFFREEQHFEFLRSTIVAERPSGASPLKVWSMPCSTGEEPYSVAMTLLDASPAIDFSVLASDLSTKALNAARAGVYKLAQVEKLRREVLRAHFERGYGDDEGSARVTSRVRSRVAFRRLNVLEVDDLGIRFDVIFCRNLLIYFDTAAQQRAVSMLERHLAPGGYLFISHAESLNGVTHALRWKAPAIYRNEIHG